MVLLSTITYVGVPYLLIEEGGMKGVLIRKGAGNELLLVSLILSTFPLLDCCKYLEINMKYICMYTKKR